MSWRATCWRPYRVQLKSSSQIVAVVPMKRLSESKTRLSGHLSPRQRAALSLSMLSWVVHVLGESRMARVVVIGGDGEVRAEALREGAEWVEDEYLDLNRAIEYAFGEVGREGGSAAYTPADLPLLTAADVDGMIEASEDGRLLTMCRAHDGGTNGLVAPPGVGFRPLLGPDSFGKHERLARELGIETREHSSAGFDRDVDTVEDLRVCMGMRPPCLAKIANELEGVR